MTTAIYGNSVYSILLGTSTWHSARDASRNLGGDLLTINNKQEFQWGALNFWSAENFLLNGVENEAYGFTGFNDEGLENEGIYSWSSGEATDFDNDPTQLIVAQNWFDQQGSFGGWDYGIVGVGGGWDYEGDRDPRFLEEPEASDRGTIILTDASASFYKNVRNATIVGLAEIPLNLSVGLPESVEEGTEFTVDINLTAGTTGSELTQGTTIWYTYEINGVDGNGDSDVFSVTGSGQIDANGQFDDGDGVAGLQISIDKDWVFDDDQFRLTFYSDDPSGTGSELGFTDPAAYRDAIQIDVDQAEGGEIIDGVVVADILGIPDPITGIFDGPGTVNLNNKGVTPFTLFGSDEINVSDIEVDSLVFGGEGSGIGVAEKKNGTLFAAYEDVNGDEILDLVVKVETSAFAGVAPTEPFEVFGSLTDETRVVFGLNESDSINFIA